MVPSRLPYPWKIVVAAVVVAVLIVAVMETRKRWNQPPQAKPPLVELDDRGNSAIYDDTLKRVQEIVAVFVPTLPEILSPEMQLVDLGIDPLTRVDVAEALESAYRIELPTDELNQTQTVDDLVRLVIKHQQGDN